VGRRIKKWSRTRVNYNIMNNLIERPVNPRL
jgi:hypothetical protein